MTRRLYLLLAGLLLCACSQGQVKEYRLKVVKEYPHRTDAYTQGLFFHGGVLYETTGQYGESSIRTVDLQTGEPVAIKRLSNKYFGEGSFTSLPGPIRWLSVTMQLPLTTSPR